MANVITKKTLIPLSLVVGTVVPGVRWVVGLEKKVEALEISDNTFKAEVISQLRNLGIAIDDLKATVHAVDVRGQRNDEKVNVLIRMLDRKSRQSDDP